MSATSTPFWDSLRSESEDCIHDDEPRKHEQHHQHQEEEEEGAFKRPPHGMRHHHRQQQQPPLKSVAFATKARVRITVGRWELNPQEREATWLTADDTQRSQDDVLETIRAMRKLCTDDDERDDDEEGACSLLLPEGMTSRGVEHMRTRKSISDRRFVKLEVVDAVLEEQARQRGGPVENPITLAEASMLASKKCRVKAERRAVGDARFARVYHAIGGREDQSSAPASRPKSTPGAAARRPLSSVSLSKYGPAAAGGGTIEGGSVSMSGVQASPGDGDCPNNAIQVQARQQDDRQPSSGERVVASGEILRGWNSPITAPDGGGDGVLAASEAEMAGGRAVVNPPPGNCSSGVGGSDPESIGRGGGDWGGGAMFANISHGKLRERLMKRATNMAMGA